MVRGYIDWKGVWLGLYGLERGVVRAILTGKGAVSCPLYGMGDYITISFHRVPEITFQPPMVGVDQSGLSETLEFVLQYYPPEVQQRLVQVGDRVRRVMWLVVWLVGKA